MHFTASGSNALPLAGTAIVVQHGAGLAHPDLVAAEARGGGALARALELGGFEGKAGQISALPAPAGLDLDWLVFVGAEGALTPADYRRIGAGIAVLPALGGVSSATLFAPEHVLDVARGLALRNYRFARHKSAAPKATLAEIALASSADIATEIATMMSEVAAVHFARDLVNEPGNVLPPAEMAARIAQAAQATGLRVEILDQAALARKGFNLLLGVGQGSANPGCVVIMRLGPAAGRPLALVGKGVTFDMGGVNVKPVGGMWEMKGDMAGAAAIAGTMLALARTGHDAPLVAVLGLAENMTGGSAIRPGDILTSLAGKTVEVRNTDCEGRLILADCIAYAQREFGAHTVIDAATLTYAVQLGLGTRYAGLYGNRPGLIEALRAAAGAAGELVWPMPVDAEFHRELASDFADLVNWPGVTYGNASIAAAFLEEFVEPDVAWAHIDIAGPAYAPRGNAFSPPGGTGFGVEMLLNYVRGGSAAGAAGF